MNPLSYLRLLLAYRGHHRSSQNSGFVMPLVILIGLTLTIVGFAMMQRASSQKNDATSKEATAKALSVAEAGVTQVMNLINTSENRFIAALPDCTDPPGTAGATCSDTGSTPSWSNLSNLDSWTIITPGAACQPPSTTTVDVPAIASNRDWKPLPQGEYRLVSYAFTPDTANGGAIGLAPGTGTIVAEGVVNRGQANEAKSRIEVTVPITREPNNTSVSMLWVTQTSLSTGTNIIEGNQEVNSNILVNDCDASVNPADFPGDSTLYEAVHTNVEQPTLPPYPSTCTNDLGAMNLSGNTIVNIPRSTDTSTTTNGVQVYSYCVDKIEMGGNSKLNINTIDSSGNRYFVVFYLKGDIDGGGTPLINHICNLSVHGASVCSNVYRPTDFVIYGYGSDINRYGAGWSTASSYKSNYASFSSSPPEIVVSGNSSIDAFVLAPDYGYGVSGGGSAGGFTGALIIEKVLDNSGSNKVIFNEIPGITWGDLFSGISAPPLPPTLNAASGWSTRPVN